MPKEKRTFSRVPTRIKALARRAESLQDPLLYKSGPGASPDRLADAAKSEGLPQPLIELLAGMDKKLNMLLSHVGRESLEKDFPLVLDVREISGAGIRFRTKEDLEEDDILEVVLLLGQNPPRMAGAKGRVKADRKHPGVFGFEFLKIRESDQEAVVQFVFQEEREQIRDRKLGASPAS